MSKVQKHNRILMILMTIVFMAYVPILFFMQPSITWLPFALLVTIPVYWSMQGKGTSAVPGFGWAGDLILVGAVLMLYAMYSNAFWHLILLVVPLADAILRKVYASEAEKPKAGDDAKGLMLASSAFALLTLVCVTYAYAKLFRTGITTDILMGAGLVVALWGLYLQLAHGRETHRLFIELMDAFGVMFLCNMLIIHFDRALLPYELAFFILFSGYGLCLMAMVAGRKKTLTQSAA